MESLGTALVPLVQFWGAKGLRVQQEPTWLQVTQGSQVTLACQMIQSQASLLGGAKDGVFLCEPHVINRSLRLGVWGPRKQPSWKLRGNLTLRLDHMSLNDSGDYTCRVAVEIAELEVAEANGMQLLVEKGGLRSNQTSRDSGLLVAPPWAGGVAGRGGPKDARPRCAEGKVLDIPRANQEGQGQSFYSISQPPRPPTLPSLPPTRDLSAPQERLAQKPSPSPRPRSAHPISAVVSPEPRPSGPQRPRGLLEVGRRTEIPGKTPSHQRPRENVPDFQESGSPTAQPKTPASLP
ncbi:unnamed protein product [Nyctereutes procyonoides]|uniref:(raccoon dog) hypothetical protein n=1 Tax=Nyctereutes procyonoides TaxID=34880 RepID=A0A811ZAN7_NYCPR|nr:unnamed protein product [Nyctereutes procyonoides]